MVFMEINVFKCDFLAVVRNLVPEELDLVPDPCFSSPVSSWDFLVPGLVPGLIFGSWVSSCWENENF